MPVQTVFWPIAAALGAAVLLGGCTGQARTFGAAKPIVLGAHAVAREPVRATAAPVLSRAEKERLFQSFRRSQRMDDQAVTASEAPP